MVWVKKSAAPAYVNALSRLRLAMGGGGDDWLLPWLNLLDAGEVLDVNAFCAAGPPDPAVFTIDDFLPAVTGGLLGPGAAVIMARDKINARAQEVLFGSLCEQAVAAAWVTLYDAVYHVTADWWSVPVPPVAIPSGATKVRVRYQAGIVFGGDVLFNAGGAGSRSANYGVMNQWQEYTVTGADLNVRVQGRANQSGGLSAPYDSHVEIQAWLPAGVETYTPATSTQPASALLPAPRVYTTIADLGAELDQLEMKLHWLLNFGLENTIDQVEAPLVADELIDVVADDGDIPLAANVRGFIVTVSNIGNQTDERFGEPRMLHKLGRVVMGSGVVWLPPVEITVSPMLLLKPDPTVTVCRVQVYAPSTAVVTTLVKPGIS